MNSEFPIYKFCSICNVRFYVTEYYEKKLYYMHVHVLVRGIERILYFPMGDKIGELKRIAESYNKGEMKPIDVCECFVTLEQKYFIRDLQTGCLCRDESGKYIQVDKYPIYAGVYLDDDNSYCFIKGNDIASQRDQLIKRGVLVLSVGDKRLPAARFYSRELSIDELLK